MSSLEQRVTDLEKKCAMLQSYFDSLVKKSNLDKSYTDADISGVRSTTSTQGSDIEQNTADIDFIAMEAGIDLEEGK